MLVHDIWCWGLKNFMLERLSPVASLLAHIQLYSRCVVLFCSCLGSFTAFVGIGSLLQFFIACSKQKLLEVTFFENLFVILQKDTPTVIVNSMYCSLVGVVVAASMYCNSYSMFVSANLFSVKFNVDKLITYVIIFDKTIWWVSTVTWIWIY